MSENEAIASILAAGIGIVVIFAILVIALAVAIVVGRMKFFQKAGQPGWAAWIPFYSDFVLVKAVGLDWWWFLLLLAGSLSVDNTTLKTVFAVASIFGWISVGYNLSKKINKGTGWVVLTAIFSGFMIAIAGYSKNITVTDVPVDKMGIISAMNGKSSSAESAPTPAPEAPAEEAPKDGE